MRVLGVDPGKKGGFALARFADGAATIEAAWNVEVSRDGDYLWGSMARTLSEAVSDCVMVVECTRNVRTGAGGRSSPAALVSLSECRGGFEAIAGVLGWKTVRVAPITWQCVMLAKGPTDTKARAQDALFHLGVGMPSGRDNEGTRDAALVALWYGRELGLWVP